MASVRLPHSESEARLDLRAHDLSRHPDGVCRALRPNDHRIDVAHARHRIRFRFERALDQCDNATRPPGQKKVDRVSSAPADRLARQKLAVAVEKDRVRLRLGVDIDPDRRAIVMRPMLDFEDAAADTQSRISAENENARRCPSAVLPGRQFFLAALRRPAARLLKMRTRAFGNPDWIEGSGLELLDTVSAGDLLKARRVYQFALSMVDCASRSAEFLPPNISPVSSEGLSKIVRTLRESDEWCVAALATCAIAKSRVSGGAGAGPNPKPV